MLVIKDDRRGAWRAALACMVTLAVAMGLGRFAFTPMLPVMLHEGKLDLQAGGVLASLNYLGYFVGALSCAAIRFRPASMVRVGLVATAVLLARHGSVAGFRRLGRAARRRRRGERLGVRFRIRLGPAAAGGNQRACAGGGDLHRPGHRHRNHGSPGRCRRTLGFGGGLDRLRPAGTGSDWDGLANFRRRRVCTRGGAGNWNALERRDRLGQGPPRRFLARFALWTGRFRIHHFRDLPSGDCTAGAPGFGVARPVLAAVRPGDRSRRAGRRPRARSLGQPAAACSRLRASGDRGGALGRVAHPSPALRWPACCWACRSPPSPCSR